MVENLKIDGLVQMKFPTSWDVFFVFDGKHVFIFVGVANYLELLLRFPSAHLSKVRAMEFLRGPPLTTLKSGPNKAEGHGW